MPLHNQPNHANISHPALKNDKLTNNLLCDDRNELEEAEVYLPTHQTINKREMRLIYIIQFIVASSLLYNGYHKWHPYFFDPSGYLEPCNATDAPTIPELQEMKEKLTNIQGEKDKFYQSHVADKKLIEKLSNIYINLEEHYITQKAIRLNCYKENLYPKVCTEFTIIVGSLFIAAAFFISILFYLTLKRGTLKRTILFTHYLYGWISLHGIFFFAHLAGLCDFSEEYIKKFPF